MHRHGPLSMTLRASTALPLALTIAGCAAPGPAAPDWESLSLTVMASGTDANLRGIAVWDEDNAWASGSAGTYVRTTDGGRTWHAGQIPGLEDRELRDIHLFGPGQALVMVVASPAELWRSDDAGEHWRLVHRDDRPEMFLDSMDFWPNGRGLCFGDPVSGAFTMWVSDETGEVWSSVPPQALPVPHPDEAGFAASGTLVRCLPGGRALVATGGGAARILETLDYGVSWTAHDTPMAQGAATRGSFSLGVGPGGQALLVGGLSAEITFNLGNVLFSLGRKEAAAQRFMQTVELEPDYVESWNNLGNVLGEMGEVDESIRAYRHALMVSEDYLDARYNLAETLANHGRLDEAFEHWHEYLELDGTSAFARMVRERMARADAARRR